MWYLKHIDRLPRKQRAIGCRRLIRIAILSFTVEDVLDYTYERARKKAVHGLHIQSTSKCHPSLDRWSAAAVLYCGHRGLLHS